MEILKALSPEHKTWIEKYIYENTSDEGRAPNHKRAPIDKILTPWAKAKDEYLYKMFDGNMILSKRVAYQRDFDELYADMSGLLFGGNHNSFVSAYKRLYGYNGPCYRRYEMSYLMEPDALARNIFDGPTFQIEIPNGKTLKIQNGMKAIRAISKIAEAFELEGFEEFRIAHSQILNQKELHGNLCISIHPLDYMTMSDNNCEWESCMNWRDNGDYRRGTVEMMNSKCVVVAYLTAEDDMPLFSYGDRNIKWNNKKWRELFIVTPEMIGGIKGYPYQNVQIADIVASWLRELAIKNLGYEYFDDIDEWNYSSTTMTAHGSYYIAPRTMTMYNDHSTHQRAYLSPNTPKRYDFFYSGDSECMWCGSTLASFTEACELICGDCIEKVRCFHCGERLYDDDEIYYLEGEPLCHYCYSESAVSCEGCEDDFFNDSLYTVEVRRAAGNVSSFNIEVCENCLTEWKSGHGYLFNKYGEIYSKDTYWGGIKYFVKVDNFTDEAFEVVFGVSKEKYYASLF